MGAQKCFLQQIFLSLFLMKTRQNTHSLGSDSDEDFSAYFDSKCMRRHDIEAILPDPPEFEDPVTLKAIKDRNKKLIGARIKKINTIIHDIFKIWPRATYSDIYIAFELCDFDKEKTLEFCTQPDFREKVKNERSDRILSKSSNKLMLKGTHNFTQFYNEGWTKEEIDVFMTLNQNHMFMKKWDLLKEYIPNKNKGQFKKLFNYITDPSQKVRTVHGHHIVGHVASLTFIKNGHEFHVGSNLSKVDKMSMMNPIPGFIDPITCNPMSVPTLSPDGYVLDYTTWTKLIKEKKGNPYTQLQIVSKRSLTVLTFENFEQYRSSIINWEDIKPPGFVEK